MTSRTRWTAGTVGAALLLAGCGGAASSTGGTAASAPGRSPDAVLTAYQRTVAARTASMSLDETVRGTANGSVAVHGTGQVDFTTGAASFSMSVPSIGPMNMRLLNPMLYLQFPSRPGTALPAGKSWVSIDLDSPAITSALGASFSQLTGSANVPTDSLSYLQAVSAQGVTTVGPATVRGVPTTEYSATIDVSKADQNRSPAVRSALQKLQSELGTSSLLPVDVWIDAQGQIRRESLQEAMTAGGTKIDVGVTVEFFDFGAPVDVAPPPADQTVDISSMVGALPGSSGG
ncbi:MAG TPA: hypothetical protein VND44_04950 [Acidimicrobiales bacterium]|nr:hypothetical protein [Acidimicrobiales bacterium]